MASWKSPQFFASLAAEDGLVVDPAGWVPPTEGQPLGFPQRFGIGTGCERLWRIRSTGREVLRFAGNGTTPLTRSQIEQPSQLPAGASANEVTHYKKLIKLQSRALTTQLVLDIGQTIELYGFSVDIDILAPANAVEISNAPGSADVDRSGLVADTILAVEILAIEAPLGNRVGRFTQHVSVAANTQETIAVPFGAIGVRIIQTPAGTASTAWNRFIGDPAIHASLNVGVLNFTARVSDLSSTEIGDCTHLQTDLDALNDRFYTLIWRIRP